MKMQNQLKNEGVFSGKNQTWTTTREWFCIRKKQMKVCKDEYTDYIKNYLESLDFNEISV